MQIAHALNLFDSLHTMLDMESSKRFGTVSPDVLSSRTTAAGTTGAVRRVDVAPS